MYKVFVENRELIFTHSPMPDQRSIQIEDLEGKSRSEQLKNVIEKLEYGGCLQIVCERPKKNFREFFGSYKSIEAAGGLVEKADEFLFIERFGLWDLPKGKIESGETPENAAIREVEEECGVSGLELIDLICETLHTYEMKGRNCLKRTFWYRMRYKGNEMLKPQQEEGITDVKWIKREEIDEVLRKTYPSIRLVYNLGEK